MRSPRCGRAFFTIDPTTGVLAFVTPPDFEARADRNENNIYDVVVKVTDSKGDSDRQAIAVAVTNVNEAPRVVTTAMTVNENITAVGTVLAGDPEHDALTLTITGGADAARFGIDAVTGQLTFAAAPDFENPQDADGDNVYEIAVQASDGALATSQAIAVSVTDVSAYAVPFGPELEVNTTLEDTRMQAFPQIAALTGGGFVVVWQYSSFGRGPEFRGRLYDLRRRAGRRRLPAGGWRSRTSRHRAAER